MQNLVIFIMKTLCGMVLGVGVLAPAVPLITLHDS